MDRLRKFIYYERIFHDIRHPADLSSINKFTNASRKSRVDVESYLKTKNVNTLFKRTKKKFKRRRYMGKKAGYIISCDIAYMKLY